MKKRMMAIYALVGALAASPIFTSCVDSDESASVSNIRNAKTEQLKAISSMSELQAELVKIQADAEAEMIKAKTALEQAEANADAEKLEFMKKSFAAEIDKISAQAELRLVEAKLQMKELNEQVKLMNDAVLYELCEEYLDIQDELSDMTGEYLDLKKIYLIEKNEYENNRFRMDAFLAEFDGELEARKKTLQFFDSLSFGYDLDKLYQDSVETEMKHKQLLLKQKEELNKLAEIEFNLANAVSYSEIDGSKFSLEIPLHVLKQEIAEGGKVYDYILNTRLFMERYAELKFPTLDVSFTQSDVAIFKIESKDMVSHDIKFESYDYLALDESNIEKFKELVKEERELQKKVMGTPAEGDNPAKGGLYGELAKLEAQVAERLEADPDADVALLNGQIKNKKVLIEQTKAEIAKFEEGLKYIQETWKEIAAETPLFKDYLAEVDNILLIYESFYDRAMNAIKIKNQLAEVALHLEYVDKISDILEDEFYNGILAMKESIEEEIDDMLDFKHEVLVGHSSDMDAEYRHLEQELASLEKEMELLQQSASYLKKRIDAMMASEEK